MEGGKGRNPPPSPVCLPPAEQAPRGISPARAVPAASAGKPSLPAEVRKPAGHGFPCGCSVSPQQPREEGIMVTPLSWTTKQALSGTTWPQSSQVGSAMPGLEPQPLFSLENRGFSSCLLSPQGNNIVHGVCLWGFFFFHHQEEKMTSCNIKSITQCPQLSHNIHLRFFSSVQDPPKTRPRSPLSWLLALPCRPSPSLLCVSRC